MGMSSYAPLVTDAAAAEKYLSIAIASKAPQSDARQQLLEASNPTLHMPAGASLPIIRQIMANNAAKLITLKSAPDQTGMGFLDHQTAKSELFNAQEGLQALSFHSLPKPSQRASRVFTLRKAFDVGFASHASGGRMS
jgi:hypothetical protein